MLTLDTKVCQSKEIDSSDLDGEKVMMNLELGKYFAMNSVGSRIWDIIEKEISINDLVNTLIKEYDIEKDKCQASVLNYLGILENEKLIETN